MTLNDNILDKENHQIRSIKTFGKIYSSFSLYGFTSVFQMTYHFDIQTEFCNLQMNKNIQHVSLMTKIQCVYANI